MALNGSAVYKVIDVEAVLGRSQTSHRQGKHKSNIFQKMVLQIQMRQCFV